VAEPLERTTRDELEADVAEVIQACGGTREALRALLIANRYLAAEVERLEQSVSRGFTRGRSGAPQEKQRSG
jgi:hypothetical protein